MDISKIKETLFLNKGEGLVTFVPCKFETTKTVVEKYLAEKRVMFWKQQTEVSQNVEKPTTIGGYLVLTTDRLIFLQESGFFKKETTVVVSIPIQNITNVSTGGIVIKHLDVSAEREDSVQTFRFQSQVVETFINEIIEQKNKVKEKKAIIAKKVIIEEKPDEKPIEVLKRRLANGEITLEEFHEKVQRM